MERHDVAVINHPCSKRQTTIGLVFILIYFIICTTCFAITPKNNNLRKNGNLTIDCSHIEQGYILAKANKTDKKLKIRVKINKEELLYNINQNSEWETISLQYGNGKYTFQLYQQASGKQYSQEGLIEINVKMSDPTVALLCPNQYIDFTEDTEAVQIANKLCENLTDPQQIYATIKKYIIKTLHYDYIKALTVQKKGELPDINTTCETHMGICQDISAVTVAMLRSQGIPSKLVIGKCDTDITHAWVTVILNEKETIFDPVAEILHMKCAKYTPERYY